MKPGFTILELVVAMLILAILTAAVIPRVTLFTPSACDEFAVNFNRLLKLAYVRALSSGKLHRIFFHAERRTMHLEMEADKTPFGKRVFEEVADSASSARYVWRPTVAIRNFFIKKMDENTRGTLKEVWLYVFPAGLTQEVIINIEDDERHDTRGLVINPFSSQCSVYETMQRP